MFSPAGVTQPSAVHTKGNTEAHKLVATAPAAHPLTRFDSVRPIEMH